MSHVPLLRLERFVVRDLPPDEAAGVRAHADGCGECRQRIDELRADDRERLARIPPAAFVRRLRPRPRVRIALFAVLAGAAATAAATFVLFHSSGARLKGAGMIVHVQRDGRARRLEEGDRIRAGDDLRLALVLPKATTVRVAFVDARGRKDELPAEALAAGEQLLAGAVRVEAPCADMTIVADTGDGTVERRLRCE